MNAARGAALAAAQDERAFDEDFIVGVALRCHLALERARERRDWHQLQSVVAPGLLEQLRAGWSVHDPSVAPRTLQTPRVRIVSLANTREPSAARCVVEMGFAGGVAPLSGKLRPFRALEYWTFRRDGGRWKLAAIDAVGDASHHWDDRMIADAAADPAIRREAVFELAADDAVADRALSSGLVRAGTDARRALADLALVDERFAWHVITQVIDEGVEAWMAAAEHGSPDALTMLASEPCARALLHPRGASGRLVVRALRVVEVAPLALRAHTHPVSLIVALTLRGTLSVRTPDGSRLVRGSGRRKTTFVVRWKLVVDAQRRSGWRLQAVAPDWLSDALGPG